MSWSVNLLLFPAHYSLHKAHTVKQRELINPKKKINKSKFLKSNRLVCAASVSICI